MLTTTIDFKRRLGVLGLGVLILGILNNGVNTYNVPVEAQHILIGVIIVANTALSQWNSRSER